MAILRDKKIFQKKSFLIKKTHLKRFGKSFLWFSLGAIIGFFFFCSFIYISYKQTHTNLVYNGVFIDGISFGGKTKDDVARYFAKKNERIQKTTFLLTTPDTIATVSARQLGMGYDSNLLAQQAMSIGRAGDVVSNLSIILQAYVDGINLPAAYHYNEDKITKALVPLQKKNDIKPVDALFTFENGKVIAFRLPKDGQAIDTKAVKKELYTQMITVANSTGPRMIVVPVPIVPVKPKVSQDKANNMGITELIGEGSSQFQGSIENRVFNINLAASRLNGILIPPGQTFSFTKTVGDVSSLTGYKQAYVIENGRTVLGDGGGVCQVSTTLFRAALNAGLPIVERNPHAYRVGYYEQDSDPGVDAAIYYPNIDLKFKNDTGHHILLQAYPDLQTYRLTFRLYGTKDNRNVVITKPVIHSQTPAPEALYQDDPTLPKGQVKQVDFAAAGAKVSFKRTVTKDGKPHVSDTFVSNYRPWQAIYMRGTKE